MAIVKMKKATIVAVSDEKDAILKDLFWMSSVDVCPIDENIAEYTTEDGAEDISDEFGVRLNTLVSAEKILAKYAQKPRSLFTPFHELSRKDFESFDKNDDGILKEAQRSVDLTKEIENADENIRRMTQLKESLLPWSDINLKLNESSSSKTSYVIGTMPEDKVLTDITDAYLDSENTDEKIAAWGEIISEEKTFKRFIFIYLKDQRERFFEVLSENRFNEISFPGLSGTPAENISVLTETIKEYEKKKETYITELRSIAKRHGDVEKAIDIVANEKKLFDVRTRIALTGKSFIISGWCPEGRIDELTELENRYTCCCIIEEPEEDEEPPVLLKNAKLVTPFEPITEMYALPTYRGLDPNFMVAPFYFVLFGMMLSDAGYGFLLTVGCFLALKLMHFKPGLKKMLTMFMYGGLSAIFWGVLFGSCFGDSITVIGNTFFDGKFSFSPVWFDPINEPMTLMIISFIVGYVHIIVGMCLKGYMLIRDGHTLDAIFDIGFWLLVLLGIPVFLIGGIAKTIAIVMIAAGALGLVLTQGRSEKNIFKKISSGVLSLYGITGYMADVLSYSRILALCLSTGVIASVFNKLGSMGGNSVLGVILFIIVFIVGHVLNTALSLLSAYVHDSRLQFIEFFGKFYESGGTPYTAFGADGKYSNIRSTDDLQ